MKIPKVKMPTIKKVKTFGTPRTGGGRISVPAWTKMSIPKTGSIVPTEDTFKKWMKKSFK